MPFLKCSTLTLPALLLAVATLPQPGALAQQTSTPPKPATPAPTPTPATVQTPEATLRTFLIAMFRQDEKGLRDTILPVSQEDFAVLATSRPMPPALLKEAVAQIAVVPVRALKSGETFPLPDGKTLVVTDALVSTDRVLLLPAGFPLPVPVRKTGGKWRVDAGTFITSRKAAKQMQQKNNSVLPESHP